MWWCSCCTTCRSRWAAQGDTNGIQAAATGIHRDYYLEAALSSRGGAADWGDAPQPARFPIGVDRLPLLSLQKPGVALPTAGAGLGVVAARAADIAPSDCPLPASQRRWNARKSSGNVTLSR